MNRQEHIAWCKERALEYLDPGPHYSVQEAVASMGSDLGKHEETRGPTMTPLVMLGMMEIARGENAVRRWIEGFN